MDIKVPCNVGDKCFALYDNTTSTTETCNECGHTHKERTRIAEVRECIIDGFEISVHDNSPLKIWYRVAFNNGTHGYTVEDVFKTKEEAENKLKNNTE